MMNDKEKIEEALRVINVYLSPKSQKISDLEYQDLTRIKKILEED